MELLLPDSGLLFWMVISFGAVLFILAKYGFPVILHMVEERKNFIEESMLHAQKARDQLEQLKKTNDKLIEEARQEHSRIIQEARQIREGIISDAKVRAMQEAEKILKETRALLAKEKEDALTDVRMHIAELSVNVAEKVIRRELSDNKSQMAMIETLLDDVNKHQS